MTVKTKIIYIRGLYVKVTWNVFTSTSVQSCGPMTPALIVSFFLLRRDELRCKCCFSLEEVLRTLGRFIDSALVLKPVATVERMWKIKKIECLQKQIEIFLKWLSCLPILPEEDRLEFVWIKTCIAVGPLFIAVGSLSTGVRNHSDLVRIRAACLSWT